MRSQQQVYSYGAIANVQSVCLSLLHSYSLMTFTLVLDLATDQSLTVCWIRDHKLFQSDAICFSSSTSCSPALISDDSIYHVILRIEVRIIGKRTEHLL